MKNNSLTLDDLINEKKKNQQNEEKEKDTNTDNTKSQQIKNFDNIELQSVDISDIVKEPEKKSLEEENMERLLKELDDGIEEAKKRRFQPALDEIRRAKEEYRMRKEIGEKNPQVNINSTVELELDPSYSDKDVEDIKNEDYDETKTDKDNNIEEDDKIIKTIKPIEEKNTVEDLDETNFDEDNTQTELEEDLDLEDEDDEESEIQNIHEDEDITELETDLDLEDDKESEIQKIREDEDKKILESFKKELSTKLIKPKKNIDFSNFKITKRTASINKVLELDKKNSYQTWILPTTGISIAMSSFSAIELDELNPNNGTRNGIAKAKAMFNTIYKHLAPQCTMETMENWMKHISYLDLDSLYFAVYVACFGNSNIVPNVCTNNKCRHMFSTNPKIMDMVKFNDENKDKKRFEEIFNKDYSAPVEIEETVIPVNEKIAFGITPPSLYNSSFESAFLNQQFVEKYAGIIAIASCVNTVYSIDTENKTLTPIKFKSDANDIIKTYKYKILNLYKLLNQLDAVEFKNLEKELTDINSKIQNRISISYQVPETVCPKCGHKIEAQPMSAADLVFMRHQLIRILD